MTLQTYAIVIPTGNGPRPAALVYPTPDGAAWVEPAYLFPEPSPMPAFHRVYGEVEDQGEGFTVTGTDGQVTRFLPATRAHDDDDGSCMAALADWSDELVAQGRTEEEEHAGVAAELDAELA